MSSSAASTALAAFFQTLGNPSRIAILLAIGNGEACVCHLEAIFGWRQAFISQHLTALRNAGLLLDRRDGRYIYYRLANQNLLGFLNSAAPISDPSSAGITPFIGSSTQTQCDCPKCSPKSTKPIRLSI